VQCLKLKWPSQKPMECEKELYVGLFPEGHAQPRMSDLGGFGVLQFCHSFKTTQMFANLVEEKSHATEITERENSQ